MYYEKLEVDLSIIFQKICIELLITDICVFSSCLSGGSRCLVLITVGLGLICVLLMVFIILQHITITRETSTHSLQENYTDLMINKDQLQNSFSSLSQKKLELETTVNGLTAEKDQLQRSIESLSQKKLELQTELRKLSEQGLYRSIYMYSCT